MDVNEEHDTHLHVNAKLTYDTVIDKDAFDG